MTTVQRIEKLCRERGITVTALEESVDMSQGYIRRWDRISPSANRVVKVAQYFGVSTDYILGLSNDPFANKEPRDRGLTFYRLARLRMTETQKKKMDNLIEAALVILFEKEKEN